MMAMIVLAYTISSAQELASKGDMPKRDPFTPYDMAVYDADQINHVCDLSDEQYIKVKKVYFEYYRIKKYPDDENRDKDPSKKQLTESERAEMLALKKSREDKVKAILTDAQWQKQLAAKEAGKIRILTR